MTNENKIILAMLVLAAAIGVFKKLNNGPTPAEIESKKAEVSVSIDKAEEKVLEKTILEDTVVKCECGGTGFITHGDGHKTPCPAGDNCEAKKKKTGIMFGATDPEVKHGLIYFYTLPGCAPCKRWEAEIKPWVEKSGWDVESLESKDAAPWFEIWIDNKPYVFKGFMDKENFKRLVKDAQK